MSYRAIVLSLITIVVALGAVLFSKRGARSKAAPAEVAAPSPSAPMLSAPTKQVDKQIQMSVPARSAAPAPAPTPVTPAVVPPTKTSARKIEPNELRSAQTFMKTFVDYSQSKTKPQQLVRELTASGLKPVIAQDFNKDTGKMLVIRTDETLPGTRYFHAQFFEDDQKQAFMQHMSFEFRPAPDNMQRAIDTVNSQFKGLTLIQSSEDYSLWKAPNDYIVWVQRLKKEDLLHDPFNARGPEDEGTVRAAVELDQHGAEEDSAHLHR